MGAGIKKLQDELQIISNEIHSIQDILERMDNEDKVLLKRKKDLQYRALFYLDKIENLKDAAQKDGHIHG